MAIPAHKTEYFIIENSNLQKKANTACGIVYSQVIDIFGRGKRFGSVAQTV